MKAIALLLLVGCGGAPRVEKCHPDFGSLGGGDDIKVMGSGFSTGVTVKVGVKSARVVSVTPDAIEIQTPASNQVGPVDVTVIGADGTALLRRACFRYQEEGQGP